MCVFAFVKGKQCFFTTCVDFLYKHSGIKSKTRSSQIIGFQIQARCPLPIHNESDSSSDCPPGLDFQRICAM